MGFVDWLTRIWLLVCREKGVGISLIVPASLVEGQRAKNWAWLREYWRAALPGAEIVIGTSSVVPFSKSRAVNDGVRRSKGDILVIIDADVLISPQSIIDCATEIRKAERKGHKLWFMPYRILYRLTEEVSARLLRSDPRKPEELCVTDADILNTGLFDGKPIRETGHWYGAMVQLCSRRAFDEVGGWDIRFRGWGGEDHAAMVAMDTLYGPHKNYPGSVAHLWHPVIAHSPEDDPRGKNRRWPGQESGQTNNALSHRYYHARGNYAVMRKLLNEGLVAELEVAVEMAVMELLEQS